MSNEKITTGPVSGLSTARTVAGEFEKSHIQAKEKNLALDLEEGDIRYTVVGYPVFNCTTKKGRMIRFEGGCFILRATMAFRASIFEALEEQVELRNITKGEAAPEDTPPEAHTPGAVTAEDAAPKVEPVTPATKPVVPALQI